MRTKTPLHIEKPAPCLFRWLIRQASYVLNDEFRGNGTGAYKYKKNPLFFVVPWAFMLLAFVILAITRIFIPFNGWFWCTPLVYILSPCVTLIVFFVVGETKRSTFLRVVTRIGLFVLCVGPFLVRISLLWIIVWSVFMILVIVLVCFPLIIDWYDITKAERGEQETEIDWRKVCFQDGEVIFETELGTELSCLCPNSKEVFNRVKSDDERIITYYGERYPLRYIKTQEGYFLCEGGLEWLENRCKNYESHILDDYICHCAGGFEWSENLRNRYGCDCLNHLLGCPLHLEKLAKKLNKTPHTTLNKWCKWAVDGIWEYIERTLCLGSSVFAVEAFLYSFFSEDDLMIALDIAMLSPFAILIIAAIIKGILEDSPKYETAQEQEGYDVSTKRSYAKTVSWTHTRFEDGKVFLWTDAGSLLSCECPHSEAKFNTIQIKERPLLYVKTEQGYFLCDGEFERLESICQAFKAKEKETI